MEPPPNRPPRVVGAVESFALEAGRDTVLLAADYFTDPDGDTLSYAAESSQSSVASVELVAAIVRVAANFRGTATVRLTARDPSGAASMLAFDVTVPNGSPMVASPRPDLEPILTVGDTTQLDPAPWFTDPEGDPLRYSATVRDPRVVWAYVAGDSIALAARRSGATHVTVTASDPAGLADSLTIWVRVRSRPVPDFRIELRFGDSVSARQQEVIRSAAERWQAVLAGTELPDVPITGNRACRGASHVRVPADVTTVDDLLVMVEVEEDDGPGGTLARAGPCLVREESLLPVWGVILFDSADLDRLIEAGGATELAVHEFAHTLGFIEQVWDDLGLIRNPSSGFGGDPHFVGERATAAFDAAGGTSYAGAKVPLHELGAGSANSHWRGSVFKGEVMAPTLLPDAPDLLSAITIQAMADMGYAVDASLADPYTLPADGAPSQDRPHDRRARAIHLGEDVLRGPIPVVDQRGRIVRFLRIR